MRESPYFEGSLNPNHCLKGVQTLEDYFESKGQESFIIAIEILQGPTYSWFKNLKREIALQGKPRIKTWRRFKSYMDVRFYRNILRRRALVRKICLCQSANQGSKGKSCLGPRRTPYYSRKDKGLKRRAYHRSRGG